MTDNHIISNYLQKNHVRPIIVSYTYEKVENCNSTGFFRRGRRVGDLPKSPKLLPAGQKVVVEKPRGWVSTPFLPFRGGS